MQRPKLRWGPLVSYFVASVAILVGVSIFRTRNQRYNQHFHRADYSTFEELEVLAKQFRAALSELGFTVYKNSVLNDILNEVESLPAKRRQLGISPEPKDVRPMWRDILTVRRFALKFVRLSQRAGFEVFVEHLSSLNSGNFAQNKEDRSAIGNKMFELWIGMLAFEVGTDVVIDPFNAKKSKLGKKKVDILVTHRGVRWAIECKAPGGRIESILNRFDEAIDQIEASPGVKGIVMISGRNFINHDAFWPRHIDGSYESWTSREEAQGKFRQVVNDFADKLKKARTPKKWNDVLSGKRTMPLLAGFFQSACSIDLFGKKPLAITVL